MAVTLGQYNPLRYRGYVYDTETGFYYLQSRYYDPELSRFINADAFVSTGQGLLGNNMFAYCNNNPGNYSDPSGMCGLCLSNKPSSQLMVSALDGCCGGGGGGYAYAGGAASAGANLAKKVKDTIYNTSATTVQANLHENGVAFYKGELVFAVDIMGSSALSFGIILMGSENLTRTDFEDTLNHEYGHYEHMKQIGVIAYAITAALPSLCGAGLSYCVPFVSENYTSQPWERVANQLGGVDDTYLPGANTAGALYYLYTLIISAIIP